MTCVHFVDLAQRCEKCDEAANDRAVRRANVTGLLEFKDAEIARLRKGLEVFANRASWDTCNHGPAVWARDSYPAAFAREVLEGKP